MMRFWTNFAKNGEPGESTNSIEWDPIVKDKELTSSYIILDRKENLKMNNNKKTFKSLAEELHIDKE